MSSEILRREKLTAYQRWELHVLDGSAHSPRRNPALPTATEVEQIHQSAHAEGYAIGLAEGRQQGAREAAQLRALVAAAAEEFARWESSVAEDILSLALDVAAHVLRGALSVRRELIIPVVREAMQHMPLLNVHARMLLHPEDAALVREHLGEELTHGSWKIVEESRLARGDCRIESSTTHVDATVATRWKRVAAALGRDTNWLAGGEAPATAVRAPAAEPGDADGSQ
jgi:flagellar assembly protein FliH